MAESSTKQKTMLLGLAGAAALVGAALVFHYAFARDEDEEEEQGGDLMEELRGAGLDQVQKGPSGMIDPKYFLKLVNFVSLKAKSRRERERNQAIAERRELYKAERWEEYKQIVEMEFTKEDQMAQVILQEALGHIDGLSEQEFGQTMQALAQHPQLSQMLMAAQQGKMPDEVAGQQPQQPKLSKAKTLKAFEESKKLTMDAMKRSATAQAKATPGNEMEMMIEALVEQAKLADALFIKEGVENEDLELSLMCFVQSDKEVQAVMRAYMIQMQQEMAKMGGGGGMPGMPGM